MHLPALDSDAWVAFLGTFLGGFPDLHLDVQDNAPSPDPLDLPRHVFASA